MQSHCRKIEKELFLFTHYRDIKLSTEKKRKESEEFLLNNNNFTMQENVSVSWIKEVEKISLLINEMIKTITKNPSSLC